MRLLNPLRKYRLQLNRGIREHVGRSTERTHRIVVDVQPKAVKAQEDTYPVQVTDDRIAMTNHAIQQIVVVVGRIVVTNHEDRCMGSRTDDTEPTDPRMVGKQTQLRPVVGSQVRVRWHAVHVMRDDDAQATKQRQVDGQLSVPRRRQNLVQPAVTFTRKRTPVRFQDLLHAVADTPVGTVHVTRDDE